MQNFTFKWVPRLFMLYLLAPAELKIKLLSLTGINLLAFAKLIPAIAITLSIILITAWAGAIWAHRKNRPQLQKICTYLFVGILTLAFVFAFIVLSFHFLPEKISSSWMILHKLLLYVATFHAGSFLLRLFMQSSPRAVKNLFAREPDWWLPLYFLKDLFFGVKIPYKKSDESIIAQNIVSALYDLGLLTSKRYDQPILKTRFNRETGRNEFLQEKEAQLIFKRSEKIPQGIRLFFGTSGAVSYEKLDSAVVNSKIMEVANVKKVMFNKSRHFIELIMKEKKVVDATYRELFRLTDRDKVAHNDDITFPIGFHRFANKDSVSEEDIVYFQTTNPHTLLAGSSGAGKGVMLRIIIAGLMTCYDPADVQIEIIDPKGTDLIRLYRNAANPNPHFALVVEGTSDESIERGLEALREIIDEMERRYALFREHGVANLYEHNALQPANKLARHVFIIDEFADFQDSMTKAQRDVFVNLIKRCGQKARAAGIHLLIAIQSARHTDFQGGLKANVKGRIGLATASPIEEEMIWDTRKLGTYKFAPKTGDGIALINGEHIRLYFPMMTNDDIDEVLRSLKAKYGSYDAKETDHDELTATERITNPKLYKIFRAIVDGAFTVRGFSEFGITKQESLTLFANMKDQGIVEYDQSKRTIKLLKLEAELLEFLRINLV